MILAEYSYFLLCILTQLSVLEKVFESQSEDLMLNPEIMIGRNNSIEMRVKITAIKFILHPRIKRQFRSIGARDSSEIEVNRKSRGASKNRQQ